MRTYRVKARYTTYLYLDVQANSEDEAYAIANEADGGVFREEPMDAQGAWELYDCEEV